MEHEAWLMHLTRGRQGGIVNQKREKGKETQEGLDEINFHVSVLFMNTNKKEKGPFFNLYRVYGLLSVFNLEVVVVTAY